MNTEKKRVPMEEVEKTQAFLDLTPKQKLFVQTYVESGYDKVFATRTAFACKTEENARIMSYAVMQTPAIISVLNIHFANDPREEWLKLVERAAKNKHITNAQLDAIKFYGQTQGFTGGLPSAGNDAPKPKKAAKPRKNSKKPVERESKPERKYKF